MLKCIKTHTHTHTSTHTQAHTQRELQRVHVLEHGKRVRLCLCGEVILSIEDAREHRRELRLRHRHLDPLRLLRLSELDLKKRAKETLFFDMWEKWGRQHMGKKGC